jgi:hypothetical protein
MLNSRRMRLFLLHSRMVKQKRSTRRLRKLRGGGTASYGFTAPPDFFRTVNNGTAYTINSTSPSSHYPAPTTGGGLPGFTTGTPFSLQKGGGGGTHYGFSQGGGLFGGVTSIPTNCALPQSGASGNLNVPQGAMAGGRRNKKQRKSKSKKSRSNKASRRR